MSEEEYQNQVQSLIVKRLETPKNLGQETQKYWQHISSGYYEFDRGNSLWLFSGELCLIIFLKNWFPILLISLDDTDVEEIRKITKQDFLEFYNKFIIPNSSNFKKLSVHLRSQKNSQSKTSVNDKENETLELELKEGNEIIDDIVLWKSHMKLGPAPTPVIMFNDSISKL